MSPNYSLHHLIAVALIASGGSAVGLHLLTKTEGGAEPTRHGALVKHAAAKPAHTSPAQDSGEPSLQSNPEPAAKATETASVIPTDANDAPDSKELGSDDVDSDEEIAAFMLEHSEHGHSLSDSLSHLETEYKAMLARTERMEAELLALKIDRLEKQIQEASSAALAGQTSAELARPQQTATQGQWLAAENDLPTASAPNNVNSGSSAGQTITYAAQTTSSGQPDTDNTITQTNQNQTVVYSYVPIVVGTGLVSNGRLANNQTTNNQGQTANGYTSDRSLYQMGMQQQRAIRSPLSAQSTALGTPLSPWAPIDMSKHHNPWGNSAFP